MSYVSEASRKRRVFFSFHYSDIIRVNNVRLCGEFKTDKADGRSIEGFYDFSMWEKKKSTASVAGLKQIIRGEVNNTSTVCVLAGAETWARKWVRYEIARAVIDNRGLITILINSINHHVERTPHPHGPNPLDFMGVGLAQSALLSIPQYYLYEKGSAGQWIRYNDHIDPVNLPAYLSKPSTGYVVSLSSGAAKYDFVSQVGHKNIGSWIDQAAQAVGR